MTTNKILDRVISTEIDRANQTTPNKSTTRHKENDDVSKVWLRDCQHEVAEPIEGFTTGNLPIWLNGNLLRNGTGRKTFGDTEFKHLFDSSAMLHSFKITNGTATYQSKFLKSKAYIKNLEANRITVSEFGTRATPDPCKTIFQKSHDASDNCLVSVFPFRDEFYAMTETPKMIKINKNLDTERTVDVSKIVNIVHHTAHPHITQDGTVYNIGISITVGHYGPKPKYSIVVFPNTNKDAPKEKDVFDEAHIVASVDVRWPLYPGYMHSYGITKNYFIIVEQPLSISIPARIKSIFNSSCKDILKSYDDQPTLFHVVSRKTGKTVKRFKAETFFYFHIINQYEENGHVIIDICAYKDAKVIDNLFVKAIKNRKNIPNYASLARALPFRFVLPVISDEIKIRDTKAKALLENKKYYVMPELLSKLGCELPTIHYSKFSGKKYRYFYAISTDLDAENSGMIIKVDTLTKTEVTWSENGTFASEPIFVPSPNHKDEDDGVVLSALLWSSDASIVALLVLDAKSLTELGRTVFKTPGSVPKCFHGWFANDE